MREYHIPGHEKPACDNPQFIITHRANAVRGQTNGPRVASRIMSRITFVLLCRKALAEEGKYNDVAMIGHNHTGKTCYYQMDYTDSLTAITSPHPADEVDSPGSPQISESLWSGIHGGLGSGIECAECHDSDPFIHTPWIDGAKDERGETIIPKFGTHDGYAEGFNDAPYSIVNLQGQGWTMPKHLTSPEAAACTKCHRVGDGRWASSWLRRLEAQTPFGTTF